MSVIGVIGGKGIEAAIKALYSDSEKMPEMFCLDSDNGIDGREFDILIINSDRNIGEKLQGIALADENVIIINADRRKILRYIIPPKRGLSSKIITYGFNPKSCVTASSALPETVQCCIQRSIPTFSGKLLDEQEFSVTIENASVGNVLAAVTAALVDGLDVEQITRIS